MPEFTFLTRNESVYSPLFLPKLVLSFLHGRSAGQKWNLIVCDNADGSRGYYAKWNKSDRERQNRIESKEQNKENQMKRDS